MRNATRVVVKVGSSTLARDPHAIRRLASAVAVLRAQGRQVVLVSSGAIALGFRKLGYKTRPKETAKLQASAAAGQSSLMRAYEDAFEALGLPVAQVLLTHADLAERTRVQNARAALAALLAAGAVPVLNENDSVAVDEIKFGDNDQLAAMVTPLVDGELLLLLSDVEGLLDPRGQRVPVVNDAREVAGFVKKSTGGLGAGGMHGKVEAARRAALAGADVIIAHAGRDGVIEAAAAGEDVGTLFPAAAERMSARRSWIAFTLRPRGDVVLDAGAVRALHADKSVLLVGVLGVRGTFRPGDAVRVLSPEGQEVGRGLARLGAEDAAREAGKKTEGAAGVLVHKDELVVWPEG